MFRCSQSSRDADARDQWTRYDAPCNWANLLQVSSISV